MRPIEIHALKQRNLLGLILLLDEIGLFIQRSTSVVDGLLIVIPAEVPGSNSR
jgi:hypothetical protein